MPSPHPTGATSTLSCFYPHLCVSDNVMKWIDVGMLYLFKSAKDPNQFDVLLVKIEGPVWYTIYHHLSSFTCCFSGGSSNPSINQPTNGKRTSMIPTWTRLNESCWVANLGIRQSLAAWAAWAHAPLLEALGNVAGCTWQRWGVLGGGKVWSVPCKNVMGKWLESVTMNIPYTRSYMNYMMVKDGIKS